MISHIIFFIYWLRLFDPFSLLMWNKIAYGAGKDNLIPEPSLLKTSTKRKQETLKIFLEKSNG